ncbi:MAG: protein-glutamate O-methyltransferase CheR [Taibaiella sp.]|nr:protein-glutamate O-methyltransferase CheR [Taibaiella sp.]
MDQEITTEQLKEVLLLVKARYGYDFSQYSEASIKRRLERFKKIARVSLPDLKYHLVNDSSFFFWLLESVTVNVTEMFRDPPFYKALVNAVIPLLQTYPRIKIWHAGCSTGEEAYSMAILLHEAGLLERTRIYATDINMANIEKAASGIITLERTKEYTANYHKAGGNADFSDYYSALYDNVVISKELKKNILFSQHNLVVDEVFNEFQLICCRNVMIYFNHALQAHVIDLFYRSLSPLGFLALGTKESLLFSDKTAKFEVIDNTNKIFRLKANG